MAEVRHLLHQVAVEYVCDACGEGTMVAQEDQIIAPSRSPGHLHKCTNCGEQQTFTDVRYPGQYFVKGQALTPPGKQASTGQAANDVIETPTSINQKPKRRRKRRK